MGNSRSRCAAGDVRTLPATSIAAAVCIALYGTPRGAAGDQPEAAATPLQEVTVTATRREQALEAVPYSISVVSADRIAASGATDLMSLAEQVPGLAMLDYGARFAGVVTPIIRGINATASPPANRAFRTFEQAPVGTYIGNSPIDGYYYIAQNGSGRVLVVDGDRKLVRTIDVPTPYVTNVAFGPDGTNVVFVTGAFEQWKPPFPGAVYRWLP